MLNRLNKEQILAAVCLTTVDVAIPGRDGFVTVRSMSGYDRDQYIDLCKDRQEGSSYYSAAIAVVSVVDPDGNRVFTPDDIQALREMPHPVLNAISEAAAELNGFNKKPEQAAA